MMTLMSRPSTEALSRARAAFETTPSALESLARDFSAQMTRGIEGRGGSLKMLRTFTRQPTGRESGRVVVVDWGGTNGRAALVELSGAGSARVLAEDAFTFTDAQKQGRAAQVFDVVAAAIGRVVDEHPAERYPLGFVYSFPARLERIDRAVALALTKGWSVEDLEGRDVAALLGDALRRRGLDRVTVAAVANDTVATLMRQSYQARGGDPDGRPADVGLILGTGTNQAADLGPAGIRNLESGNFDGVAAVETPYDAALDRALAEPKPGAQRLEKMASGHYLGELLRRVVCDVGEPDGRFRWAATSAFDTPFAVGSELLSRIAADRTPALEGVDALLRELRAVSTREEREAVRDLSAAIVRRAARLVAATLLGTLRFIDPALAEGRTIAVDGSLWGGYPGFESLVRGAFVEVIGRERAERIHIAFVKDATSTGAAVIAAAAATKRSQACSSE
jgi:hexokinase